MVECASGAPSIFFAGGNSLLQTTKEHQHVVCCPCRFRHHEEEPIITDERLIKPAFCIADSRTKPDCIFLSSIALVLSMHEATGRW